MVFLKKGVDNINPLCYNNYRKTEREVIIMKIYVFESTNDVVIRKAAKSIDEAIAWFKATYPTRAFSCVYEQ